MIRSCPLAGNTERLAGKSGGQDVDAAPPLGEVGVSNIGVMLCMGIIVFQYTIGKLVDVGMENVVPSQPESRQRRSVDSGTYTCMDHNVSVLFPEVESNHLRNHHVGIIACRTPVGCPPLCLRMPQSAPHDNCRRD